jgi:hypothetical protein
MRDIGRQLSIALGIFLVTAGVVTAVPTLDTPEGWSNSGNEEGWVEETVDGAGSTIAQSDAFNGETALVVTFAAQGFPASSSSRIAAGTGASSGNFTGDYSGLDPNTRVRFELYAEDHQPSDLAVYFESDQSGSLRRWTLSFSGALPTVGTWTEYAAQMQYGAGWDTPGSPGSAAFNADLADVDELGVLIARGGSTDQQDFGMDDFRLSVTIPEPHTWALLGVALVSVARTVRRSRKDDDEDADTVS